MGCPADQLGLALVALTDACGVVRKASDAVRVIEDKPIDDPCVQILDKGFKVLPDDEGIRGRYVVVVVDLDNVTAHLSGYHAAVLELTGHPLATELPCDRVAVIIGDPKISPLRVIPAAMAGGAVTGALSMAFGCTLRAPHGGIFVVPLIGRPFVYLLAIAAGTGVSAALVIVLKGLRKPPRTRTAHSSADGEAEAEVTAAA
ncbi:hypothetical protein SAMN05428945_2423 [Streptomyces sp. 2224.1]|nr:hypothetical protein SAMN05428945_2423 [Streptomyces sp. 2224.1]